MSDQLHIANTAFLILTLIADAAVVAALLLGLGGAVLEPVARVRDAVVAVVGPEARRLASMILWGPPGTGKTTIARLLAKEAGYEFQQLSAVFSGVADLKKAFEQLK